MVEIKLILAAIVAALQFPEAVVKLVNLLRKTPQEKHEDLLKKIDEEASKFENTGRPSW